MSNFGRVALRSRNDLVLTASALLTSMVGAFRPNASLPPRLADPPPVCRPVAMPAGLPCFAALPAALLHRVQTRAGLIVQYA